MECEWYLQQKRTPNVDGVDGGGKGSNVDGVDGSLANNYACKSYDDPEAILGGGKFYIGKNFRLRRF